MLPIIFYTCTLMCLSTSRIKLSLHCFLLKQDIHHLTTYHPYHILLKSYWKLVPHWFYLFCIYLLGNLFLHCIKFQLHWLKLFWCPFKFSLFIFFFLLHIPSFSFPFTRLYCWIILFRDSEYIFSNYQYIWNRFLCVCIAFPYHFEDMLYIYI